MPEIRTVHLTTSNGMPYTGKTYVRPGFSASIVVGDIESFGMLVDNRMTFYPEEVREISSALNELADWMDGLCTCGHPAHAHDTRCDYPITEQDFFRQRTEIVDTCDCTGGTA